MNQNVRVRLDTTIRKTEKGANFEFEKFGQQFNIRLEVKLVKYLHPVIVFSSSNCLYLQYLF